MTETSEQVEALATPAPVIRTFLIADVRGYTRFTNEQGVPAAARLADRFAVMCRDTVSGHEGEVLELRGDEALCVFYSPRSALLAAVELQGRFRKETQADPTLPLRVGMGIDVGEVVPIQGGYRGKALNLAARLCSLASPGEVFSTEDVVAEAERIEGLAYVERGRVQLKGFEEPIRVIHILPQEDLPENFPPLVSLVAKPSNLPLQTTPFIGREQEIGEVAALLRREEVRLVTLTGTGGTGKTRLALQVGGAVLEEFERGVFFVDLAPLADPELVASTIASTLKVREVPGQEILTTLIEYLQDRHLLLVLDNFEHLVPAAAVVHQLLTACSPLTVLVTSRAVLHLSAEHEYQVPPLAVPDPAHLSALEDLSQYEAVALFIERARAVKPAFAVSNETAPAVAEICVRLDGLPLAIELAAARIKLFPPGALLQRLSNRLTLLTGGATDRPTRQQTLRGAIDWSYSLLVPQEQTLLARLSVFAGGWTFAAAEAVTQMVPDPGGELDLLEGLASLVDKSLVRQEGVDEPRFSMLETIREYASERLEESGESRAVGRRHAAHFLRLVLQAEPELRGPRQVEWLSRLDAELDNLRDAQRWLLDVGAGEDQLRLAAALEAFWRARGYFSEGQGWLDEGLTRAEDLQPSLRATALLVRGMLLAYQGAGARAGMALQGALDLFRELGDHRGAARTLVYLGLGAMWQGQYERAAALWDESERLLAGLDDPWWRARLLGNMASMAMELGDRRTARERFEESLTLYRSLGDPEKISFTVTLLGRLAYLEGNLTGAAVYAEEGLSLARPLRARRTEDYALLIQGLTLAGLGQLDRASERFRESLLLAQEIGDRYSMLLNLAGLALVAAKQGEAARAARLKGAEMALDRRWAMHLDRTIHEQEESLAQARQWLGEEEFSCAWEQGHAMSLEDAIADALGES